MLRFSSLILIGLASVVQTTPFEQDLVNELDRIQHEYSIRREKSEVARLVLWDQQLRELIPSHEWQSRPRASSRVFRKEYEQLGIGLTLFDSDSLSYSGKLLLEAHRSDPRSLRAYTLYSAVFGEMGESSNDAPDPSAAKRYLKEFPRGPFAISANVALAYFYDDFSQFIGEEMKSGHADVTHECFRPHLDKTPLMRQRQRAQQSGVLYYEQLTRLLPQSRIMRTALARLRAGRNDGWHFCGD